jgi:fermentation-respiration switch protein FrsA (DUF1100 family)
MLALLAFYLFLAGLVWFCSDRLMFLPRPSSYRASADIIRIGVAPDVSISALYLPNSEAVHTILYSHGNAEDLGDVRPRLADYQRQGFAVFSYDYEGYGTSEGTAAAGHALRDAEAAFLYLVDELSVPPERIILHGRSIGGGPTFWLAERHRVAGVVAESCFVSAFRVMTRVPFFPFDKYRNLARVDRIGCPLLVIHGTADRVIPVWHGRKLFERARAPKTGCWLDGADHNDLPDEAEKTIWTAIRTFAKELHP